MELITHLAIEVGQCCITVEGIYIDIATESNAYTLTTFNSTQFIDRGDTMQVSYYFGRFEEFGVIFSAIIESEDFRKRLQFYPQR